MRGVTRQSSSPLSAFHSSRAMHAGEWQWPPAISSFMRPPRSRAVLSLAQYSSRTGSQSRSAGASISLEANADLDLFLQLADGTCLAGFEARCATQRGAGSHRGMDYAFSGDATVVPVRESIEMRALVLYADGAEAVAPNGFANVSMPNADSPPKVHEQARLTELEVYNLVSSEVLPPADEW